MERNNSDQDWTIKRNIAETIASEPIPSVIRLQEQVVEEFGYKPDNNLIDYFIETIKVRRKKNCDKQQDSALRFACVLGIRNNISVPEFYKLFKNEFGGFPPRNILKYFLVSTTIRKKISNKKERTDFILTNKIANSFNPTFRKLYQEFEDTFNKSPSLDVIDYFILIILENLEYKKSGFE